MNKIILSIDLLEEICKALDVNSIQHLLEVNKETYKAGKKLLFLRKAYIQNINTISRLQFHFESSFLKWTKIKGIKDVNLHIPILPEYTRIEDSSINPFYNEIPNMFSPDLKELHLECENSHIHLKFENMPNIRKVSVKCNTLEYHREEFEKCKYLKRIDVHSLHVNKLEPLRNAFHSSCVPCKIIDQNYTSKKAKDYH